MLRKENFKVFNLKLAKNLIACLVVIVSFELLAFPWPILASGLVVECGSNENAASWDILVENPYFYADKTVIQAVIPNNLPSNADLKVRSSMTHVITAYNSEKAQTDDSPCITANGFNVCIHGKEDTIAANFLPFGTRVKIPDLFGDRVFIVRDRMNRRYSDRVDVWMLNKTDARKFGVKVAKIEVLRK